MSCGVYVGICYVWFRRDGVWNHTIGERVVDERSVVDGVRCRLGPMDGLVPPPPCLFL